ncbi:Gamma-tubulin complex component 4 [Actinomortierella wolfii]|nr:Gamma-tubulin complex component 4 [Actinomortierella wolfii]
MLHELLLALAGFPGNVFRPFPPAPQQPTTLALSDDFPMIHPGDRETLNRLAVVGFHFMTMNKFIETSRSNRGASSNTGLYRKAMAIALERRLQGYRKTIVECERSILSGEGNLGSSISLSELVVRFSEYQLVFPVVCNILSTLGEPAVTTSVKISQGQQQGHEEQPEDQRMNQEYCSNAPSPYHGAKLIDLLQEHAASGVSIVQDWLGDMLSSCCSVMMRQIVAWVIYGQIQDPFEEWFIMTHASKKGTVHQLDPRSVRHGISSPESVFSRRRAEERMARGDDDSTTGYSRQTEYILDESRLPKMIPVQVANEILFIGKAIITAGDTRMNPTPVPDAMTRRHLGWIMPLVQSLSRRSIHPSHIANTTSGNQSLPPPPTPSPRLDECHSEYLPSSFPPATATQPFPLHTLSQILHSIRKDIIEHLWVNVRVGKAMVATLRSFQRYFLLADGDFGIGLIDAIDEFKRARLLCKHGTGTGPTIRTQDLSDILFKAAKGTPAYEDASSLQRFELRVLKPAEQESQQSLKQPFDDQLLGIPTRLQYRMTWPLDLLLTEDDVSQYSDLFALLISVRKAQVRLQRAWIHVKVLSQLARRRRHILRYAGSKRKTAIQRQLHNQDSYGGDLSQYERLQQEQNIAQEEEIVRIVSTMRSNMMCIVDGLWSYFQMDVLGPKFNDLINSIAFDQRTHSGSHQFSRDTTGISHTPEPLSNSSFDFDSIYSMHSETLHVIQSSCLLASNELAMIIKAMLQAIENLTSIVARRAGEGEDGFRVGASAKQDELTRQDWADLSDANKTFREQTQKLFMALSTVSKSGVLEDEHILRRSSSMMGSSFQVGRVPKPAVTQQLDRLLLRLEYARAAWLRTTSARSEAGVDIES